MGIFGTAATVAADLNLIVQYVTLILLVFGYTKRRRFKTHGRIMVIVTVLTIATTLLVMAPSLIVNWGTFEPTILAHVAIGILVMLLGLVFTTRFYLATKGGKPLACGTRNIMRLAFILWLFPILGGTMFYINTYVLV
ncbi:MAG: hypothetical protein ACXADS_08705 [Candidatus Thorarchaeota archaeon]